MKTNLTQKLGGGKYAAPSIEVFEIVTEKGFAQSDYETNGWPDGKAEEMDE